MSGAPCGRAGARLVRVGAAGNGGCAARRVLRPAKKGDLTRMSRDRHLSVHQGSARAVWARRGLRVVIVAAVIFLGAGRARAQAALWQAGTNYAVGDFARTGTALTSTYRCIQHNVAAQANRPPNAQFWQQVWPRDPPVAANGDGPTGDDWVDFAASPAPVLFYDNQGVSSVATTLSLKITVANGNFVLGNNRTGGGVRVAHVAYQDDYGRANGPTVQAGNTDWDNYYGGYNPAITRVGGSNATDTTNCVSYAFNAYVPNAVSSNWTNSGADAAPFENELQAVAAMGQNGAVATQGGDRCYNDDHVWTLTGAGAATGQLFKNNSSPLYQWAPNPYSNNGAAGGVGGAVFQNFAIGRRP